MLKSPVKTTTQWIKILALTAALIFTACTSIPKARAVDIGEVEKLLEGDGATGWIHGSVSGRELSVFTYRNPENFFDYVLLSLTSEDPSIRAQLASLGRHDKVKIKGSFLDNPSPQKHVDVRSIEVVEKFKSSVPAPPYDHSAKLPDELLKQNRANFLVHAVFNDGKILVVEYKDQIVPIFVRNTSLSKDLFRGDQVEIQYRVQREPKQPTHLRIDERAEQPVTLTHSIRSLHGKAADFEGALILFPKSPEIIFNVFAIQEELGSGLKRQYTLVNFNDREAFARIRAKLQTAWDKHPGQYQNARNKYVSLKVRVRAKGTFNIVDPNQANPQILLTDENSIEVIHAAE